MSKKTVRVLHLTLMSEGLEQPYILNLKPEERLNDILARLENPPKHGLIGVQASYGTVYFNPRYLITLSWTDEEVSAA